MSGVERCDALVVSEPPVAVQVSLLSWMESPSQLQAAGLAPAVRLLLLQGEGVTLEIASSLENHP